MGFVLPHLFSQVYFVLDKPVPPCAFFFSWVGGGRGGAEWVRWKGVEFEYCIALQQHIFIAEKSSPFWALNSISSYCVYSPTLTLFLREMISFADVERNTCTKDSEDFYKK